MCITTPFFTYHKFGKNTDQVGKYYPEIDYLAVVMPCFSCAASAAHFFIREGNKCQWNWEIC